MNWQTLVWPLSNRKKCYCLSSFACNLQPLAGFGSAVWRFVEKQPLAPVQCCCDCRIDVEKQGAFKFSLLCHRTQIELDCRGANRTKALRPSWPKDRVLLKLFAANIARLAGDAAFQWFGRFSSLPPDNDRFLMIYDPKGSEHGGPRRNQTQMPATDM